MTKTRVLLIDDEADFRRFMQLNLEDTGRFEVLAGGDGGQAVKLAKAFKPDVILMDVLMPDVTGAEAAENLLDDKATRHIPIIFLTALAKNDEIKASGGKIAGRDFIAKPIGVDALTYKIEQVLKRGGTKSA